MDGPLLLKGAKLTGIWKTRTVRFSAESNVLSIFRPSDTGKRTPIVAGRVIDVRDVVGGRGSGKKPNRFNVVAGGKRPNLCFSAESADAKAAWMRALRGGVETAAAAVFVSREAIAVQQLPWSSQ